MHRSQDTIGRYPLSILIAIGLHLTWACGLALDPTSIGATGPHALILIAVSNPHTAAAVFFVTAVLATAGVLLAEEVTSLIGRLTVAVGLPRPRETWVKVILLLPQQAILWVSCVGVVDAMALGQFADGTMRDHWFLIVDQIPVVLVALGHTAALLLIARGEADDGQR